MIDQTVMDEYDAGEPAANEFEQASIPAHISLKRGGGFLYFLAFIYMLVAIGSAGFSLTTPNSLQPATISFATGLFVLLCSGHILVRWIVGGSLDPFSLDVVFIGSFLIFTMGIWIQCLFGLIPYEATYELKAASYSTRATLLCTSAAAAFLAGYLFRTISVKSTIALPIQEKDMAAAGTLAAMGFGTFSVSIAFRVIYIFGTVGAGQFFQGEYSTLTMGLSFGELMYKISETLAQLGIVAMAVGYAVSKQRLAPKVFWPVYGAYILLLLVDGERGIVFQTLLVLGFVRHLLIKPVKWRIILPLSLALIFVFASVRVARMMQERSLTNLVGVMKSHEEGMALQSTLIETSNSFTTLTRTMRQVPRYDSHKYGRTLMSGVLSIVPGASGVAFRAFGGIDAAYYVTPATWLTYREAGLRTPKSGLGFSSVAEAYLNFGTMGIPFVFLLAGFVLRGVEFKTFASPSLTRLVVLAILLGNLFYWARGSIDSWFRPIAWAMGMVWIATKFAPTIPVISPEYDVVDYDQTTREHYQI